jgi:hypothetical protein
MIVEALKLQLELNQHTLERNTEGLTNADSLVAPEPGGNCLNWVVGHVVNTRNAMLGQLGLEPIWEEARGELYGRGSPSRLEAARAVPLEEMLADFDRAQAQILDALDRHGAVGLERETQGLFVERSQVGKEIATLIFHEAYHLGQAGLLRRLIGRDGAIP